MKNHQTVYRVKAISGETIGRNPPPLSLLTFDNRLVGIQKSWPESQGWVKWADQPKKNPANGNYTQTVFIRNPPTAEDCSNNGSKGQESEELNLTLTYLRSLNSGLNHYSMNSWGSKLCDGGIGKLWRAPETPSMTLLTFQNKLIGIQERWFGAAPSIAENPPLARRDDVNTYTLFLRHPPTNRECAQKTRLSEQHAELEGRRILDCKGPCRNNTFYSRPVSCDPWFSPSLSAVNCNMTVRGMDKVTFVAGPVNFVTAPFTEQRYQTEYLMEGRRDLWDIEFLPDGTILLTEHGGSLLSYSEGNVEKLGNLSVVEEATVGLMGLAVHPNYAENKYVYLYYSYRKPEGGDPNAILTRISRFQLLNGTLQGEEILLDRIPARKFHAGGRLEFGPDGRLYATTGEAGDHLNLPFETQDPSSLKGKILRMNPDGSIPQTNPFNNSYVYSRGHRNPQGLAWHPSTSRLYASEHGPWRHDEINKIRPGSNYGWPQYECSSVREEGLSPADGHIQPIWCATNWTLAPSGMTFVDQANHPWYGDLFVSSLRSKHIHRFALQNGTVKRSEIFFINNKNKDTGLRIRDIEFRNGSLWAIGDFGGIFRISSS